MTFRIIRLASDYGLAIAVTPADAEPSPTMTFPEGTTFYRWADWKIGDHEPYRWNEVTPMGAMMYFSGQADGLGYGEIPEQDFESLEQAEAHLKIRRDEAARQRMAIFER